jgi:hypothetical protein
MCNISDGSILNYIKDDGDDDDTNNNEELNAIIRFHVK